MDKTFRQVFEEHQGKVSDKWSLYLDEWDRIFPPFQDQKIRLLEIGIQNGGSLEVWSKCFVNAEKIIGCDIDEKCASLHFSDPRINVVVSDANTDECENQILQLAPAFDIIIDDGSHVSGDIVRSFGRYFPHLADDGIYLIEDIHTSYWKDYGGGLNYSLSAMEFFKRLADIVNYEHWRNNKPRSTILHKYSEEFGIDFDEIILARIHSIEFVNSLCIIRKMPPEKNSLGRRVVTGMEESVVTGWKKYNGTLIQDLATDIKTDPDLDVFELNSKVESLSNANQNLTGIVEAREQSISSLQKQIAELGQVAQQLSDQLENREKLLLTYANRIMVAEQSIRQLTSQIASKAQSDQSNSQQALELAEIKSSHAWRLVQFIWRVRSFMRTR